MKFTGEYRASASPDVVWKALNDPAILEQCVPGCESIVAETPTDWAVRLAIKVGPVRARFSGKLRLTDLEAPHRCRIVGEGDGGAAGFAQGVARVELIEADNVTILYYEADTQIGGKLAQVGARLIDSFAKRYADEFFAKFSVLVSGEQDAGIQKVQPAAAATSLTAPPHLPKSSAGGHDGNAGGFNSQSFTIIVLAVLLAFMTVMFALKG